MKPLLMRMYRLNWMAEQQVWVGSVEAPKVTFLQDKRSKPLMAVGRDPPESLAASMEKLRWSYRP
jgi:hypothetical protein